MTRDFEVVRNLLLQIEAAPSGQPIHSLEFEGDDAVLAEYLEILIEAGLLDGKVIGSEPVAFAIRRLTWEGHDFIEKARNDTTWNKVMGQAKKHGGAVTLAILKGLLTKAAESAAGL
jgi:hypothetical protein